MKGLLDHHPCAAASTLAHPCQARPYPAMQVSHHGWMSWKWRPRIWRNAQIEYMFNNSSAVSEGVCEKRRA